MKQNKVKDDNSLSIYCRTNTGQWLFTANAVDAVKPVRVAAVDFSKHVDVIRRAAHAKIVTASVMFRIKSVLEGKIKNSPPSIPKSNLRRPIKNRISRRTRISRILPLSRQETSDTVTLT